MTRRWQSAYLRMAREGPRTMGGHLLFWGLSPLSFLYGRVMFIRRRLYKRGLVRSYRAAVPVISVGNLVTAGTGKTPMVDNLARKISSRGIRCAIVSRGFGGHYRDDVGRVSDDSGQLLMTPEACGDEPFLLARRNPGVPVYVARRRVLGVQAAERDGARVIVLDDGFQHLALKRDLDILLLDAQKPFGNGQMLPAGILREPRTALQSADLIILTRSDSGQSGVLPAGVTVMQSRHRLDNRLFTLEGREVSEREYAGKSCLAFAGIARPEGFFRALDAFGFRHIETIPLADHQVYTPEILNRLLGSCHNHDLMVTTEKDAVKLTSTHFPKPCYQIGVELIFDDPSPLEELMDQLMESHQ